MGPAAWIPNPLRRAAPRFCDVFGVEPLRLPATELAWPYSLPEPCSIRQATDYTTSMLLGWARTLDRWGGGDWLRRAVQAIDETGIDADSACEALRRARIYRHYRVVVVGAASAALIGTAHALAVAVVMQQMDRHTHLLTGACVYLMFPALMFAGLMDLDAEDRDLNGRWDGCWATGTTRLFFLTLALARALPDQYQTWVLFFVKGVLNRLLRLW